MRQVITSPNHSAASGLKGRVQLEDLYLNDNFNGQKHFDAGGVRKVYAAPALVDSAVGVVVSGYSTVRKGPSVPQPVRQAADRQVNDFRASGKVSGSQMVFKMMMMLTKTEIKRGRERTREREMWRGGRWGGMC